MINLHFTKVCIQTFTTPPFDAASFPFKDAHVVV